MRHENLARYQRPLTSFYDLEVFQKAYAVSLRIHALTHDFPKTEQYGGVADQLRRSSKSICANIAEGFAKRKLSGAEFKRFLMTAFGSCEETRVWLCYAKDLKYIESDVFDTLSNNYDEVGKMIYGLHNSWEKR